MSTTLKQRAAEYFGVNNTRSLTGVPLGRDRYAFVSPTRMWIYEQSYMRTSQRGMGVNLTEKMRADLLDALGGTEAF